MFQGARRIIWRKKLEGARRIIWKKEIGKRYCTVIHLIKRYILRIESWFWMRIYKKSDGCFKGKKNYLERKLIYLGSLYQIMRRTRGSLFYNLI